MPATEKDQPYSFRGAYGNVDGSKPAPGGLESLDVDALIKLITQGVERENQSDLPTGGAGSRLAGSHGPAI